MELSKEDVEVTWYRNKKKIEESSRYIITKERTIRKLIVRKATFEDEYEYSCIVEKYNLKTSSKLKIGGKLYRTKSFSKYKPIILFQISLHHPEDHLKYPE